MTLLSAPPTSVPITPIPRSPSENNNILAPTNSTDTLQVAIADPSLAQNESVITHLVELINAVYTVAEEGIFNPAYKRIDAPDLRNLILTSEFAIAWTSPYSTAGPESPTSKIIGCARVQSLSPTQGVFGMLVCDPSFRGSGTGRKLVHFAEEHCRDRLGKTVMRCELLVSTEWENPYKVRMHNWYVRMGYKVVGTGNFAEEWPQYGVHLMSDVEFRVYEKVFV